MSNFNKLSRAEMKSVSGGVAPAPVCDSGQVLVFCDYTTGAGTPEDPHHGYGGQGYACFDSGNIPYYCH